MIDPRPIDPRPAPTLRVTGHRPPRVTPDVEARLAPRVEALLDALSRLAGDVRERDPRAWRETPPRLRLVGSLAAGADMLVAERATARGWALDALLPFERDAFARMQDFDALADARFRALCAAPGRGALLELDGDAADEDARTEAYVAVGRRIVANADVLIAVWDGKEGPAGGTSDVVGMALAAGRPVVRLSLEGEARLLLTPADRAAPDDGPAAIVETADGPAPSADLEAALLAHLAPPTGERAHRDLLLHLEEPTATRTGWFPFDLLRRLAAGRRMSIPVNIAPDDVTRAQWAAFLGRAETLGGAVFAETLRTRLEPCWRHADSVAMRNGHAYRSAYVVNFVFAALAVLAGLFSVVAWTSDEKLYFKIACVSVELLLIVVILIITRRGGANGLDWHRRWLQARSVAEILRPARLTLLLGRTDAPERAGEGLGETAWVEWYVRATLREIAPPTCRLDEDALRLAIDAALLDELAGQVTYQRSAREIAGKLDHSLHLWGERLFVGAVVVGVAFLGFAGLYHLADKVEALAPLKETLVACKTPAKAAAPVLGAGLPAMGAALFGIRAIGDFRVAETQAARTLEELEAIGAQLCSLREMPSRAEAVVLFLRISQAEAADLRDWTRVYSLRPLALPG